MTTISEWWQKRQRRRDCRRKYGDACPHLERHARTWTKPAFSVPSPRTETDASRADQDA